MTTTRTPAALLILGLIALGVGICIGLRFGSASLSTWQVGEAILGLGASNDVRLIWDLRLPRVVAAGLVGGELAVAGVLLQVVLRNPLADPAVLGVTGGATLGAVLVVLGTPLAAGASIWFFFTISAVSVIGGLAAGGLVYGLAWSNGATPRRLLVCGIAVASILHLIVAALLAGWGQGRIEGLLVWVAGSLYARDWRHVAVLAFATSVALVLVPLFHRRMLPLLLGDTPARGLGVAVERTRIAALVIAAWLTATSVAMVGPVGFVGLVVPHIVRLITGADPSRVLLLAPFVGAVLAIIADTLGRSVFAPYELPVGVLTALVGVPFFLAQMRGSTI